jgi:hypothetical protein
VSLGLWEFFWSWPQSIAGRKASAAKAAATATYTTALTGKCAAGAVARVSATAVTALAGKATAEAEARAQGAFAAAVAGRVVSLAEARAAAAATTALAGRSAAVAQAAPPLRAIAAVVGLVRAAARAIGILFVPPPPPPNVSEVLALPAASTRATVMAPGITRSVVTPQRVAITLLPAAALCRVAPPRVATAIPGPVKAATVREAKASGAIIAASTSGRVQKG